MPSELSATTRLGGRHNTGNFGLTLSTLFTVISSTCPINIFINCGLTTNSGYHYHRLCPFPPGLSTTVACSSPMLSKRSPLLSRLSELPSSLPLAFYFTKDSLNLSTPGVAELSCFRVLGSLGLIEDTSKALFLQLPLQVPNSAKVSHWSFDVAPSTTAMELVHSGLLVSQLVFSTQPLAPLVS